MHPAWDVGIHDSVAAGQIICSGEADSVLNGGDLFLVEMLTDFRVQDIQKNHESLFLAWVGNQAEPLGEFHDILFHIIGFLPDGMEMTTMFDVGAVESVSRLPQRFEMIPGVHVLQSCKKLGCLAFHKSDHPTEFVVEADDTARENYDFQGMQPRMHILGGCSRKWLWLQWKRHYPRVSPIFQTV